MSDAPTLQSVVLRYFECLNADDHDGMRKIWTEDAELRAVGARPRSGREDVIGYFAKVFGPWPEHDDTPVRLVVSEADRTVLAEVVFTGTTADGREVEFDAIDVFDLTEDGLIRKMTNWYDIDYARRVISPPAEASA
jgi:ketosteroid isomerase-like protein